MFPGLPHYSPLLIPQTCIILNANRRTRSLQWRHTPCCSMVKLWRVKNRFASYEVNKGHFFNNVNVTVSFGNRLTLSTFRFQHFSQANYTYHDICLSAWSRYYDCVLHVICPRQPQTFIKPNINYHNYLLPYKVAVESAACLWGTLVTTAWVTAEFQVWLQEQVVSKYSLEVNSWEVNQVSDIRSIGHKEGREFNTFRTNIPVYAILSVAS